MKVRTSSQVDAEVVYCCSCCHAHLADHKAIISKAFQGRHGRAYLFDNVINVSPGPPENRLLLTGLHVCQWRAPLNHCTAALCRGPPRPLELLLSCVRVCRWQVVADIAAPVVQHAGLVQGLVCCRGAHLRNAEILKKLPVPLFCSARALPFQQEAQCAISRSTGWQ